MASIGKIVSVRLEPPTGDFKTMANALSSKGKSRIPGTTVKLLPHRESNNKYRTGIDENAPYIQRLKDLGDGNKSYQEEYERVKKLRERLERDSNISDLSATSSYYDYKQWVSNVDELHVIPTNLKEGENIFNFENPMAEITFRWLSVHPFVASRYEAWQRGEAGPNVLFYVYDEQTENDRNYKRKSEINQAIIKLDEASLEKRKKVAKLMGLPVSDNSSESLVYNLLDSAIKQTEFKDGEFKTMSPVRLFNKFMDMQNKHLNAKYLVKEAIDFNIYRKRKDTGAIYEGETLLAPKEEDLVADLTDNKSQEELIALEEKVKTKKLAMV